MSPESNVSRYTASPLFFIIMFLDDQFKENARKFCRQFGINRLSVFGSVARGDDNDSSDIDFLAEFDSPRPATMPDRYRDFATISPLKILSFGALSPSSSRICCRVGGDTKDKRLT